MKFKLEIEDGKKTIVLVPENAGEQQVLASIYPHQSSDHDPIEARVEAWLTADRPPYKKITALRVILPG